MSYHDHPVQSLHRAAENGRCWPPRDTLYFALPCPRYSAALLVSHLRMGSDRSTDSVRYVILAGFAEIMVICFNERINLGLLRMGSDAVSNPLSLSLDATQAFVGLRRIHLVHEGVPRESPELDCRRSRACKTFQLSVRYLQWGKCHQPQYGLDLIRNSLTTSVHSLFVVDSTASFSGTRKLW